MTDRRDTERSIFRNLSPLDHRYWLANPELFDALADHLSEDASIRACIEVELALLVSLAGRAGIPLPGGLEGLRGSVGEIPPAEVYAEEAKTHHNIRALVNVLKRRVPPELAHLVHVGATSVDILDTAQALRMRDVYRTVILPLLMEVQAHLVRLVEAEADTPQIGRTHGQHAVPLTFGFALAIYVSRLGKSLDELAARARDLRGKLAGAVGAYNATALVSPDPVAFEKEVLDRLGILPSEHATQLVEPEYQLRLLTETNTAFGILANLADDLRHLQRSEIAEVREAFAATQVGSSTMPQKRNPWNCENVKSMWKAFAPRVMTFYMDQISEHQRDLTNSASGRFVVEYLAGFVSAAARMRDVLKELGVDRKRMAANLQGTGDTVLAEPLYILLSLAGVPDSHEVVRKLTLAAEGGGGGLLEAIQRNPELSAAVSRSLTRVGMGPPEVFFTRAAEYTGIAAAKARDVARRHRERLALLGKELNR